MAKYALNYAACQGPAHYLTNSVNLVNLLLHGLLSSWVPLGSENNHFEATIHENGCLNGWWVRIWIGAGG
jgi:hypothetical protein